MTRAEIDSILAGTNGVTPGPWYASDWSFDDGAHTTTIETRQPEVLNPGQSSIWPDGIRKSMVATTAEADGDTVANAKHIARLDPQTVSALCTALIESMDRVEALTKFFVADEAVQEAQRSMFDSVIDGEVPKETRRGIVDLCLRRSAARQIARKSLGGSNER